MKPLFHLYAVNRDGFRITPKESEADRLRAEHTVVARNRETDARRQRWVAVEVDRASGRTLRSLVAVTA